MYIFVYILHFFGAHKYVYISYFLYIMVSHPKINLSPSWGETAPLSLASS